MRNQLVCAVLVTALGVACGDNHDIAVDAARPGHDGATDASADAAPDQRIATGTHLVARPSLLAGLTTDGYVAFSDTNADGYSEAKVIPIGGGTETLIATSTGTGKADIRFAIDGKVVFVFTDRGNRSSTLTIWSAATGVIVVGPGARPGRAAANADGTFIAYETAITATTANLVAGPIAGSASVIDVANTADNDCWQDTDVQSTGNAASQELLFRYCPGATTAWTLRSVLAGSAAGVALPSSADEASYRDNHVVWRSLAGTLTAAAAGDNVGVVLASNAADFVVSDDETQVAYLTTTGAIEERPIDASAAARTLVSGTTAVALGALSPDNDTILYATQVSALGSGDVLPYMNVLAGKQGASARTLVAGETSCTNCLHDSFTPDSTDALVLDPVDNSEAADVAGPIHVFSLADGSTVSSFGTTTWGAVAITGGSGATTRFLALDAFRDATLEDGWAYQMSIRTLEASSTETTIARAAETFVVDAARTHALTSFAGSDDIGGVYVVDLDAQ